MKKLLLILVLSIPSLPIQLNAQREPASLVARITTPLGADALEVVSFKAQEGISTLFHVEVNVVAARAQAVPFESLLGKPVQVSLFRAEGGVRHFHGICARVSQGDIERLTKAYRLEVVPQMWLLTRKAQSRTFQNKSVPEIVQSVLGGIGTPLETRLEGIYLSQKFVVQYKESDFAFISRLMEEEGISYFFKHEDGKHTLVLADTPAAHPDIPGPVRFQTSETRSLAPDRVFSWEKVQELRSGMVTLWDHCFELPHNHLEASATIQESVQVGTVLHRLKLDVNGDLELYDYPGEYAQRFDGVNSAGGEQPEDLLNIFVENQRIAKVRMEEEAAASIRIRGTSSVRHLIAGHKFVLNGHFNADGPYVLTSVQHSATEGKDGSGALEYHNTFTCIPAGLPFRPGRVTPRPVIHGAQTAVVTGPTGEEIFPDKYGRVKIQFHWDREGKKDENSSVWVRVGALHAGLEQGFSVVPKVGDEVVVTFLHGDPDQPIIIGSVYNPERMPPVVRVSQ